MGMRHTTSIHHWRFEDGVPGSNPNAYISMDPLPRGWYCWVYPQDDSDFIQWMDTYCPTAEHTFRFNSGNPMHTVYISSEIEATVFTLKWLS